MRSVGKAVSLGFGGAVLGAGLVLKRGFGELAEAQKVAAQTNAVLKSTGGVANVTGKQVEKLATSISRKTGIDDEAIAAAQNMLLTFTNVRNEVGKGNKIFDEATRAVIDLATATGRDPVDATIMLGKALNDLEVNQRGTITGWSALRRVGVKVTADMMAQGAAFIKAGKPMEAQKLLLRELAVEFGGSAAAFGTTMPGALGKMNNALDEVTAAFAQGFLPIVLKVAKALTTKLADPAFVARVSRLGTLIGTKLYNAFAAIGKWFQEHWGEIKSAFATGAVIAQRMAGAVRRIHGWFQKLSTITPGGAGTLLGIIMGGVLLSKLRLLGKAMRVVGILAGVGAAGVAGRGGKGKGGKAGGKGGGLGKIGGAAAGLAGQAGREIPWDQQSLANPGSFPALMRLARQGKLSKKALTAASKRLTPKQMRILRRTNWSNSRSDTPGRRGPSAGHDGNIVNVYIDGERVEPIVTRRQQRKDKSTAASRRGRYGGVKR